MIKIIYGPERFLVKREVKRFKKAAEAAGAEVHISDLYEQASFDMAQGGFFEYYVLIYVDDMNKILNTKISVAGIKNPVLVVVQKNDTLNKEQQKLMKELPYEWVCFNKLPAEEAKQFVAGYANQLGKRITYDACDKILMRLDYETDADIYLTNVFSEMDKIGLLCDDITGDIVEEVIPESLSVRSSEILKAIKSKDKVAVYSFLENFINKWQKNKQLFLSKSMELVGLIASKYRIAYKVHLCTNPAKELGLKYGYDKMPQEKAYKGLQLCAEADSSLKNSIGPDKVLTILFEGLLNN